MTMAQMAPPVATLPGPQPLDSTAKLNGFDSVPLFMHQQPRSDDIEQNSALSALQALAHEGTPDEIAQNFKERGNEYFKGRQIREAQRFYTQGIEARPSNVTLLEALLCNRAACDLELKNFASVLRDCKRVMEINPRSAKAFYRSATAHLALDRPEDAIEMCDACLKFDLKNQEVQQLRDKALQQKEKREKRERERIDVAQRERLNKRHLLDAFAARNLIVIHNPEPSASLLCQPHFDEQRRDPPLPGFPSLVFPVYFLYPQYAMTELVQEYAEDTPFAAHIQEMFPPVGQRPVWDKTGEYRAEHLVVYAITRNKRLLKVGKNMTLKDVFTIAASDSDNPSSGDGMEIKDGCLSVHVVPRGTVEKKWVTEFTRERDRGR